MAHYSSPLESAHVGPFETRELSLCLVETSKHQSLDYRFCVRPLRDALRLLSLKAPTIQPVSPNVLPCAHLGMSRSDV
jgi:hypothetical protein